MLKISLLTRFANTANKVIDVLKDNLKNRLKEYSNAKTIIVCGAFADAYFSKIEQDLHIENKILVPHPASNHWIIVNKYKDGIIKLNALHQKFTSPKKNE